MTVHARDHDHHGQDHDHDHDHDHGDRHEHGHDHAHGAGHGHAHVPPAGWRYGVAVGLNLAIVLIEAIAGLIAGSTALVADAGHNLSDVLGLLLAGGATWLASRPAKGQRTYGFGKATVLAALSNGLVLMFVSGGLAIAAVGQISHPAPIQTGLVMITALFGVVANTAVALMFMGGQDHDVNVRGVFLHMAGDALVSVGVIIAAGLIAVTHLSIIDPIVSLIIVGVIVIGSWGLLRESVDLALDAAPKGRDVAAIQAFLERCEGVSNVHDLHVWAMSTTEPALTAHIVRPDSAGEDGFRERLAHALEERFGVRHATLQIEQARGGHCPEC